MLEGAYRAPRKGKHDDKAHPPIHPVQLAQPAQLEGLEKAVRSSRACGVHVHEYATLWIPASALPARGRRIRCTSL